MQGDSKSFWQGARDVASTWGLATVILTAGLVIAYQFVGPAPPKHIVLATGEEGGAYQHYGEQFAAILATDRITVELRETAGSVENLQLLNLDDGVDVGFVQGGLAAAMPTENVIAIGSLYLEPLWIFVRSQIALARSRNDADSTAGCTKSFVAHPAQTSRIQKH